jgi:hypothetical protein
VAFSFIQLHEEEDADVDGSRHPGLPVHR